MKIAFYGTQKYEQEFFDKVNQKNQHDISYLLPHLNADTAILAKDFPAICCFVNDNVSQSVLDQLAAFGVKLIALRSAGYNNVDLIAAKKLGITVVRVPAYSPYAVAEHAAGLILALNRKIHRAYNRVRESDFTLHGLMGFDIHGLTVGIVGTGKIGTCFANIMMGFGCKVLASDPIVDKKLEKMGVTYVDFNQLISESDIISLHCPLTPDTHHLIDDNALQKMKRGVMLINTSRGAVIDTQAIIKHLKTQHIGYLGLDVYEEEGDLFFEDLSDKIITDDIFARLQTFPNVIITGHQAFFTREAMSNIANTTLQNITAFEQGKGEMNQLSA